MPARSGSGGVKVPTGQPARGQARRQLDRDHPAGGEPRGAVATTFAGTYTGLARRRRWWRDRDLPVTVGAGAAWPGGGGGIEPAARVHLGHRGVLVGEPHAQVQRLPVERAARRQQLGRASRPSAAMTATHRVPSTLGHDLERVHAGRAGRGLQVCGV